MYILASQKLLLQLCRIFTLLLLKAISDIMLIVLCTIILKRSTVSIFLLRSCEYILEAV